MFCARCGKEIDNDSTFCPFCGQRTDEPVESGGGSRKPKASAKMSGKKVIGGIAAVAVVVLIVFGISRVIRGISHRGESLSEKLFAMSWEEISEISEYDFKDMLDEEGTLYTVETAEDSFFGRKDIKTKTTESFMGGDCLYSYAPESFVTIYEVRYETEEDFKAGRKQIEEALEKSLLRNTVAFESTYGGVKMQFYPIGVSDKNLSENLDTVANALSFYGIDNVDELDDEELAELSQQSMYKFAFVIFGTQNDMSGITDEFVFPSDKSYTNNMCVLGTVYLPMSEEELISGLALQAEYDAVSGKEMDMDRFQESVDENFVNAYLDQKASSDDYEYRRELEKELYIRLYMMEKHKFDTELNTYLKTDDEKKMWYIRNFDWDTDTGAPVDLSDYRDSSSIYCAVECNYNSDTAEYFESELDRALYLADKDYKADTGESFGGTDEKRLWFMQNYSYDTSSGKAVDKEVVDALIAYQKYSDIAFEYSTIKKYGLIYIDNDSIPECVMLSESNELCVLSYKNGEIQSVAPDEIGGYSVSVQYTPQSGVFAIELHYGSAGYECDVIELEDSFKKTTVLDGNRSYDENSGKSRYIYTINGQVVSVSDYEGEYDDYLDQFNFEQRLYANSLAEGEYRNVSDSLLVAYDALRTIIYETCEYCIYEYELKDGILTVKADDGAKKSSSFGEQTAFEFSCPVADECVWEGGNGFGEYRSEYTYPMTPEEMEVEIKNWRNQYDLTPDYMESPVAIQFHIIDDQVVGVYTSTP